VSDQRRHIVGAVRSEVDEETAGRVRRVIRGKYMGDVHERRNRRRALLVSGSRPLEPD
jgi:hypothetical protein